MVLDPRQTYVYLASDGKSTELPGGDAFWAQPESEFDRIGRGWLVAEFEFDADWPNWEMHPDADEFVYLLSGSADLVLERRDGTQTIALRERGAVLVPRGVWHTATVHSPSRMLHVTMGSGTQQRPR